MRIPTNFLCFLPIVLSPLALSCGGNHGAENDSDSNGEVLEMEYAKNLILTKYSNCTKAELVNPWDTTRILRTYILIDRESYSDTAAYPKGTRIFTPLERTLVFSGVHARLINELGALDAIKGVCDCEYITDTDITSKVANETIVNCGKNLSPDFEKVICINPDGILLSPYENSGDYGKLAGLGAPIIECADYMESLPLGRAEWIKFFGILFGKISKSDSIWRNTRDQYEAIRGFTANVTYRPKVLVDNLYGDIWYVPMPKSTMGVYIHDAGGINPFGAPEANGSLGLSAEQVLAVAEDADIWLLRYFQKTDKTLSELNADNSLYSQFKAFRQNRVFGCNTSYVPYYDHSPFHPQWILADMVRLFHPELTDSLPGTINFFKPLLY